jgi:hypothetical protein
MIGGKYLAEKSGEIFVDDRIVAIENVPMQNLKKEEVKEIVQGFLEEEWRETLILEVESGKKSCVWYLCPYCSTDNKISDEEAQKLKSTRNKIISDHDNLGLKIRLMEEFSTQDPAQRLQIQNENLCGKEHILEYHFMKKLLCHCKTCKFPSSAANLFHDDLLL